MNLPKKDSLALTVLLMFPFGRKYFFPNLNHAGFIPVSSNISNIRLIILIVQIFLIGYNWLFLKKWISKQVVQFYLLQPIFRGTTIERIQYERANLLTSSKDAAES